LVQAVYLRLTDHSVGALDSTSVGAPATPDVFLRRFLNDRHENVWGLSQIMSKLLHHIISKQFLIIILQFDAADCELLKASLNKPHKINRELRI
jgi:hypothetical protein